MTQWGLDTLFNPAKRHMDDEKRRLQATRAEVGDNSGGKRIDLESGKVVIKKSEDDEPVEPAPASGPNVKASSTAKSAAPAKAVPASPTGKGAREPTPAQIRAAKRRGRAL